MTREQEFEKVKELIKEYYANADCGLYDIINIIGDYMVTIFKGRYFQLDICHHYSYFEVLGTAKKEFEILNEYYYHLGKQWW